jgi:Raf kinase inhibitor-like YbhB/YbcL family protein
MKFLKAQLKISLLLYHAHAMTITSPAFAENAAIPSLYTCNGKNINPPLRITNMPADTKSLTLIMDDPDAPRGTWVHWTVWNIDPSTTAIGEDSVPEATIEGITSFGKPGYGGPCPPSGTHRYHFKIYALDTLLDLPSHAEKNELEEAMKGHIIAHAELVGVYSKQ